MTEGVIQCLGLGRLPFKEGLRLNAKGGVWGMIVE